MLVFFTASAEELTQSLFEQGQWSLCQRECRRIRLSQTNAPARIELLELACAVRMKPRDEQRLIEQFSDLAARSDDKDVAAIASYESGRLLWKNDSDEKALAAFASAFYTTTNRCLFLQSACSAFLLMNKNKELKSRNPGLVQQINTSRELWYGRLFALCRKEEDPSPSFLTLPARWIIGFYRKQISPAIGERCSLNPSCSEYFLCAVTHHGPFTAVPMIADRLVREPDVNLKKNKPVRINGKLRYSDPLADHDFWMDP